MKNYSLVQCSLKEVDQIAPDFIYNRYDLWEESTDSCTTLWHYKDKDHSLFVESLCEDNNARLGIWLMPLETKVLHRIAKGVFHEFPEVKSIVIENATCDFIGRSFRNNHFRIELPKNIEELDKSISSKGRSTIRRKKRLLSDHYNRYDIRCFSAKGKEAERIWEKYFEYKKISKNANYALTQEEYCNKFAVTDVYSLEIGDQHDIAAMILSCEQNSIVYLENMAFNDEISRLSPGLILYDEYLKLLVKKGKKEIFLGGGQYSYKKRYGSIEEDVFKGVIYRNQLYNYAQWANCKARRAYHVLQHYLCVAKDEMKHKGKDNESLGTVG